MGIFFLFFLFFFESNITYAVPPPDFIIAAVSQIGALFTVVFAFLSGIFWSSRQLLGSYIIRYKNIFFLGGIILIGIVSFIVAFFWDNSRMAQQEKENLTTWIESTKRKQTETSVILSSEIKIDQSSSQGILPLEVDNAEAKNLLSESGVLFLDTREDLEYEIGNIPNSVHLRFADIKEGAWTGLSMHPRIIVICWSGMRGKEITEYLRRKGVLAQYLEHGVDSWVASGGLWQGEVKFSHAFPQPNYHRSITTKEFLEHRKKGVVILDGNYEEKNQLLLSGSIRFSTINTPKMKLKNLYESFGSGKTFLVVCDGYISCFDAKLTGIALERANNTFLGRYTSPWELSQ
ncbi:MAG: hypothetical protein HHAS10_10050 [Candidatus Altimarinota bacterium]